MKLYNKFLISENKFNPIISTKKLYWVKPITNYCKIEFRLKDDRLEYWYFGSDKEFEEAIDYCRDCLRKTIMYA